MDDEFNNLFKNEMLIGKLSRLFAFLTILISCLGLFGLAAYTAERRTKEIGIRKVLGASVGNVVTLLSKDFLRLVGIASVIAFPLAYWMMHKWLQDFAYRISVSWWIFIAAGLLALVIAMLTVSFQAIKAAIMNPVKSLRTE
jgi:ABC-type antimicrobial peptide transport system permease subunit